MAAIVALGGAAGLLLAAPRASVLHPFAPEAASIARGLGPTCMAEIPGVPISVCFAPGTPADEVAGVMTRIRSTWEANLAARDADSEGGAAYNLNTRWNINGSAAQGTPVTLRWSMPADGLAIDDDLNGGASSPNNLNATFVSRFGSVEAGKNLLRQVFARWSELTGVSYVEVSDDNAVWGSLGGTTRGDIRIAGRTFVATSVLAYNFYPNNGDMVIVTSNTGFWSPANNNRYFRNIVAHEHGHGLGMDHVCPDNQTKLMEPFITTAFDGPQSDDIRCGQRGYGDNYEPNDSAATANATVIGGSGTWLREDCSIDDNLDVDFYKFSATANSTVSVTVDAVGAQSYLSGPQNANGSCSAGSAVAPRTVHNLNVQIVRGTTGATIVATAASAAAGSAERLVSVVLPATDVYFVRVYPSTATDDVQLYSLAVTLNLVPARPADITGNGVVDGADLGLLLASWGSCGTPCPTDLDRNGATDGGDLGILLADWG